MLWHKVRRDHAKCFSEGEAILLRLQGGSNTGSNTAQERLAGRTSFLARSSGSMHERASGVLPAPKPDECPPFPLVPLLKVRAANLQKPSCTCVCSCPDPPAALRHSPAHLPLLPLQVASAHVELSQKVLLTPTAPTSLNASLALGSVGIMVTTAVLVALCCRLHALCTV
jgi:hypothetical protein